MAKYISIPVSSVTNVPSITFNTDLITSVVYTAPTTFVIWAFGKSYTFTTSSAGASTFVSAINTAILAQSGPILIPVIISTSATVSALPVIA